MQFVTLSVLFNILAEQVMRKALQGFAGRFRIGEKLINNLRYADDIVLYWPRHQKNYGSWRTVSRGLQRSTDMLINAVKMKVVTNIDEVIIDGERLEQVDSFVYLESRVASDVDVWRRGEAEDGHG